MHSPSLRVPGDQRQPPLNPKALKAGVGHQIVLDLYDCLTERLDDIAWVQATMTEAARVAGATIVDTVFHKFSPWGISGVVVISESHLAPASVTNAKPSIAAPELDYRLERDTAAWVTIKAQSKRRVP